jgi:hypothetical protein
LPGPIWAEAGAMTKPQPLFLPAQSLEELDR